MAKIIDLTLLFANSSPLVIFFVFSIFFALFEEKIETTINKISPKIKLGVIRGVCIAFIAAYASIVTVYLFTDIFLDVISPSMISISWLFATGQEIYHSISTDRIYSLLYGPAAFIINGGVLKLLGPSLFAGKLASVSGMLLAIALCLHSIRNLFKKLDKLMFFGFLCALFMLFWTFSFEARPDVFSLLFSALAIFGATQKSEKAAIIIVGLSAGLGINLKISGLFYFLPAAYLLYKKYGWKTIIKTIFGAGLFALLPFGLFENINAANYIAWLTNASRHGFDPTSLSTNVAYSLFLLIPAVLLLLEEGTEADQADSGYLKFLAFAMFAVSFLGAKNGSSQNHILPFIPFVLYIYAVLFAKRQNYAHKKTFKIFIPSFLLALLFISSVSIVRIGRLEIIYPRAARKDVEIMLDKYQSRNLNMGWSDSELNKNLEMTLPLFRPLLVFKTGNYLLDKPALSDLREGGLNLDPSFLDNFKKCSGDIWLFPKKNIPFEKVLGYGKPIFNKEFTSAFFDNFKLKESLEYFDIWSCGGK